MSLIDPAQSVLTNQKNIQKSLKDNLKVDPRKVVLEIAELSPCIKRRVGAVIVDKNENILSTGYNYNQQEGPCEDKYGDTISTVVHAELVAIRNLPADVYPYHMYITHEPCTACLHSIVTHGISYEVVKDCIKFDTGKLRYDLVPSESYRGIAEVMTFGARKYKPNNWRTVDDVHRFMAAAERHYQEFKYVMETGDCTGLYDKESGLHVLKHVMTNLTFIMELVPDEEAVEVWREKLS